MKLQKILFIIGLLIFILPILGIPSDWKLTIISVLGILIIVLSFNLNINKTDQKISDNGTFSEIRPEFNDKESSDEFADADNEINEKEKQQ